MKMQMKNELMGSYLDWSAIDYQPVMKKISLNSLDPYLKGVKNAMDVGCSKGWATFLLARKGIETIGIGLNRSEIQQARMEAHKNRDGEKTRFIQGDILKKKDTGSYDLVLLVRLLTCFPVVHHWNQLLDRVYQLVNPDGLIYIYDFLLDRESTVYMKRYLEGQKKGLRLGNFIVNDQQGNYLFVAHHHLEEELETIIKPYEKLHLSITHSLSMNGNKTKVFEFIGRKNRQRKKELSLQVKRFTRDNSPKAMLAEAAPYEEKFGIRFDSLTVFPLAFMRRLHRNVKTCNDFAEKISIASGEDKTILEDINCLGEIANNPNQSKAERETYYRTLKRIYEKLPVNPEGYLDDPVTLFIGPEREGRILAQSLGWLPEGRSIHPDAKRIPYKEGLLVGLSDCGLTGNYKRCIIIDGAIASGATLISVIRELGTKIKEFHIFSVHATIEGLRGILRYGSAHKLDIHITVGHATMGLNKKYYAVDKTDKEIVGDLGDTICDVVHRVDTSGYDND